MHLRSGAAVQRLRQSGKMLKTEWILDIRRIALFSNARWIAGTVLCAAAAAGTAAVFSEHTGRELLPLVFLAVITLVALYFGVVAGVIGSVVAAIIFAVFLFPPIGSPVVHDLGERSNVGWMLLGGLAISYLFAPRHRGSPPRQH